MATNGTTMPGGARRRTAHGRSASGSARSLDA